MADAAALPEPAPPVPAGPGAAASLEPNVAVARQIRVPDPRVIALDRLTNAIVGIVLAVAHPIVCLILWLTSDAPSWLLLLAAGSWVPVTAFLAWLAIGWPPIDYRHRRYAVDERGIEIWSGVLWRETVAVPRSRVQHIDVSQGPLERSYGLGTLSIYTAGTAYSRVDLRGLDHAVALQLRDALLPQDVEPAV